MFNHARFVNFIANTLAVLAVLAMFAGAVFWVVQHPYFSIKRIQIEAVESGELAYVSPPTIRATIAGRMQGNFFTVDLDDARQLLESAPWVRRASIHRVWPDTLRVKFEEHQPLALWNETQMINTWGEAFIANQGELPDDANLPHFFGPADSERLLVQRYAELARWFAPLNKSVEQITLSPRYAWSVQLSDCVSLSLGRDPGADVADPHGRSGALPFAARIERFVHAWPTLNQRLEGREIRSADLRYTNGFAITLAPVSITSTK